MLTKKENGMKIEGERLKNSAHKQLCRHVRTLMGQAEKQNCPMTDKNSPTSYQAEHMGPAPF